ncbi:GDSL-type esterase/lipase family protein, partial [Streptomyces sp. NPDC049040]|uniref:GDSL-type esterase/lipase family protein n=1 Tax=Streptomyces sp. NPDC049040 TaxID=3365593 RepID=UPI0037215D65
MTAAVAVTLAYGLAAGTLATVAGATAAQSGCSAFPTPLTATTRPSPPTSDWTGSWGTAFGSAGVPAKSEVTGKQTLRMVIHSSIGGSSARIHLANTFSSAPVVIGHATIAAQRVNGNGKRDAGAADVPVSLTFGGGRQTTIPAGGGVYSDAAPFAVSAGENLLISIYLPDAVAAAPYHSIALTTSYASAAGDTADRTAETGDADFPRTFPHWAYVNGLDVTAAGSGGTVVAIGDSQTDSGHTTANTNRRWTDDYGRALQRTTPAMGVLNEGISGNRLLTDAPSESAAQGLSAVHRFDRDVLSHPNVRSVILYEGINDLGLDGTDDRSLEEGIQELASRAHAAGLSLTVATIPPFGGYRSYTAAREEVRQCLNSYIRTTSDIDRYVDFDLATRDPLAPTHLFAGYFATGDDGLHLNDAGSLAVADAVLAPLPPPTVRLVHSQTVSGDFTGTGRTDLVAADARGNLYRWAGEGNGRFAGRQLLTPGWNFTQTAAGDFTGDGVADLVAVDAGGNLYRWNGNGYGGFGGATLLSLDWNFTQTAAGDFTGDGVADLVAVDAGGNLYRW